MLSRFTGVGRRFERRGERAGVVVVDDYAHHPTEVAATIEAARAQARGRVLVGFQPHLYSRTEAAGRGVRRGAGRRGRGGGDRRLRRARAAAARASPGGWSSTRSARRGRGCRWPGSRPLELAPRYLAGRLHEGDVLLTMGAGDVRRVGDLLLA